MVLEYQPVIEINNNDKLPKTAETAINLNPNLRPFLTINVFFYFQVYLHLNPGSGLH